MSVSVNNILFDEQHFIPKINKSTKCFKLVFFHFRNATTLFFTKKNIVIVTNNEVCLDVELPYSVLFGIKCCTIRPDNIFDLDFFNKYKDLIKDTEISDIKEETEDLILKKDTEYTDLQKKCQDLETELKNEQQKNEVLDDLIERQSIRLHNNIDNLKAKLETVEKEKDLIIKDRDTYNERKYILLQEKASLKEALSREKNNNYYYLIIVIIGVIIIQLLFRM